MEIRISVEAEADLQNQWLHLASNSSLDSANTFEARVDHVLALLTDQPQMGRARDELIPNLRSFPLDKRCVLFYRIIPRYQQDSVLEIIRVICGGQDLESLF